MRNLILLALIALSCDEVNECVTCTTTWEYVELNQVVVTTEDVCLSKIEIKRKEKEGTFTKTIDNNGSILTSVSVTKCK